MRVARSVAAAARPEALERSQPGAGQAERGASCAGLFYLVLFSAAMGLAIGICASDLFLIRRVVVLCEDESLQAEAAERVQELEFGLIWFPPTRALERRVGGLPRARSVRIHRHLPSTLAVHVDPRRAIAVVIQEQRAMAVDEEGVCLHWTGGPPEGMPTVHIADPSSLEVGGNLSSRDTEMVNAVLSGLSEEGIDAGASIDLSRPIRITVFTADGVLGKLGNGELLYEKSLLFGKLLHALRKKGKSPLYIDLRVLSRPTFKPVR